MSEGQIFRDQHQAVVSNEAIASLVDTPQRAMQAELPTDLFRQAVLEHAICLGMDPHGEDFDLLWIAERSLLAPLPEGWVQLSEDDTGQIYYYNENTGESDWNHPCDEAHRQLYLRQKMEKNTAAMLTRSQNRNKSYPSSPNHFLTVPSVEGESDSCVAHLHPSQLQPSLHKSEPQKASSRTNLSKSTQSEVTLSDPFAEEQSSLKAEIRKMKDNYDVLEEKRKASVENMRKENKKLSEKKEELSSEIVKLNEEVTKLKRDCCLLKIEKDKLNSKLIHCEKEIEIEKQRNESSQEEFRNQMIKVESSENETKSECSKLKSEKAALEIALRNEANKSEVLANEVTIHSSSLNKTREELDLLKDRFSRNEESKQIEVRNLSSVVSSQESKLEQTMKEMSELKLKLILSKKDCDSLKNSLSKKDSFFNNKVEDFNKKINMVYESNRNLEGENDVYKSKIRELQENLAEFSTRLRNESNEAKRTSAQLIKEKSFCKEIQSRLCFQEKETSNLQTKIKMISDELMAKDKYCKQILEKNVALRRSVADIQGRIRVLCRVRPLKAEDIYESNDSSLKSSLVFIDTERLLFHGQEYEYDHVFEPDSTQHHVFEEVTYAIETTLQGCNVCVFAYGQVS